LPSSYPLDPDNFAQMGIAPLPPSADLVVLKTRLYDDFRVEAPLTEWEGQKFIRVSVQAYNDQRDIDAMLDALKVLLPQIVR